MNNNTSLIESLGSRGEKHLAANMQPSEKIVVKLKAPWGQAFVLTDRHIYIIKWGYMTGNTFGGRCTAFDYRNVVGIEIKKNLITGTLEVISAATQNANLGYWAQKQSSAWKSNYAIPFTTQKFNLFQQAVNIARGLINKSHS